VSSALDPIRTFAGLCDSAKLRSIVAEGDGGMRGILATGLLSALLAANVQAHEGFVLKAGEGNAVLNGIVIKVSPENASTQAMLAEQTFPKGGRTGLHIHDQGDEIFYVVSGRGTATLEGDTEDIVGGDVIFVPDGTVHAVQNLDYDDPLIVVFYMDSPELAEQFRALHERLVSDPDRPISPEERAKIEERFGGSRTVVKQ